MGMLVLALVASVDFIKKYKLAKAWLDEQMKKDKRDDDIRLNDRTE